ncbi:CARDB domain-containing protein [Geomonas sp. Red276]
MAIIGTAMTAMAAGPSVSWTTKADFESNASTVGTPTNRINIDTTSLPDSIKVGVPKDFVTTATITCVTSSKIYTSGTTRTSLSVIDAATGQVTGSIPLPNAVAGIAYDADDNKLYVGQQNSNAVLEVDAGTGQIIETLSIGTATNGVYAAAYNSANKKVYLANTGDQTVAILDAPSDTVLQTVTVTAGATTATVKADNKVYLTSKSNNYVTVIDGTTNTVLQDIEVEPVVGILGGTAPGNVGLRLDAPALGFTGATTILLSWNADPLGPGQNIQLQMRTASDVASLDTATYLGPNSKADAWYDTSADGASTTTEGDGSITTTVPLAVPFTNAAEIQFKLTWDGITSPVLHDVDLTYAFTITASAGPGGSISPSGAVLVPAGTSQPFTITPNPGYHILDVKVDGYSQGAVASYNFVNVRADHTIEASFERNRYTITASAGPNGTITPSGAVTVFYDDSVTFTPTPNTGYHVDHVYVDNVDKGALTTYTFDHVDADHTISVTFAINTYTITATAGPGGSITPASATVNYGGSQTFTITPSTGYVLTNLYVDGQPVVLTTTYTFDHVDANHTIYAVFGQALPDLVVTSLTPPATAIPGTTITVPATIKNIGYSSTGTFYVGFYLCPTNNINTSCVNLATKMFTSLAPGGQTTINLNAPLGSVPSGNYYIGAIADPSNQVVEADESNNILAAATQTNVLKGPDLVMTQVTTPATATVGQQITVPVTVKNQGIGPAMNSYYVGLYLCPTSNITTSCTSLRQSLVSYLAVGAQQSFNVITTVPPVAPGTYYIGAYADSSDRNEEMDETNNALAGIPTTIQ